MPQVASTATAHAVSFSCCVRIVSSLKVEIKAQHQAIAREVRSVRRQSSAPDPRIFVVPREACAAVHDRVVAVAEHVVIQITEVRCCSWISLLRHADPFGSLEEDQLWTVHPVGLHEGAIPRGTAE